MLIAFANAVRSGTGSVPLSYRYLHTQFVSGHLNKAPEQGMTTTPEKLKPFNDE